MKKEEAKERIEVLMDKIKNHPANPLPNAHNYVQWYAYNHEVLPMFNEIDNLMRMDYEEKR